METTDTTAHIASIQKNLDPDPQLSDYDESNLWGELGEYCESDERYDPQTAAKSKGLLFPICIGDIIQHPQGRYRIVHRLGNGAYSVVWLARDLKQNICVAFKVMVAGSIGEKEFSNQHMLKTAPQLDTSHLNLYKDTFLLPSPYNPTGKPPTIFHRVLVLPLEGSSLREPEIALNRSLRSRMAAAKSLLQTLRDLHQAGFVHSDIALGNVLWKIDPTFMEAITLNPVKALGAPTERMRLIDAEGLKSGHRVVPVKFPRQHLSTEVCLADFGILLPADNKTVEYKLQGTPEYIAPERLHGHNPSPASDMWSFMVVFVYLYLGEMPFPNTSFSSPGRYLYCTWENLGPLPAKWKTATPPVDGISYAPPSKAVGPDPPESTFPSRLRKDWTKTVADRSVSYSAKAKSSRDAEMIRRAKRLKEELRVKKEAETHALKVIHSVFRYEPSHRLTAEQLLASPDWIKLMELCGV